MATTHQIEKVQMDIPQITYNLHQGNEIQFLYYNQADKTFELNQEVIDLLYQHGSESNIGKTFLFNHALDLDSRYNSFKPQLPGARMWTEPFYKKEDNLIIFFVDVEGFGTDENFSNFIWILAFMLSSCILYSSQGKISEQKMINMHHLNYLAENLQFAQGRMENEYSMAYYSPKFVWLMKDYQIDEYDDNNYQLEPDKFLEQKLGEEYVNQDALMIRDLFMNIFKDRSALDYDEPPHHQYNFEQLSLNLSPYYKDQIDFLKEKIYSNSKLKLYDGITFSCGMLINFIQCMIKLYNENEILNYQEILSAVLERECEQQLEKASQDYTNILAQNFGDKTDPISDEEMFEFFKQARQQAIDSFSIKEDIREKFEAYDEYLDKLQNYMNDQEDKLTQINEGLAQNFNQELAQNLLEKYQRELLSVEHSGLFSQKYGNVIKQCCFEYQNQAKGNQNEKVMIILLKELFRISFERIEQDQQTDDQDFNNDLEEMKQQIDNKRDQINEQFREVTIQKQQAQEEYEELVDDNEEKSKHIQNLIITNKDLQMDIQQKEDHLKQQQAVIQEQQEQLKKAKKKKGFLCFKKQFIFIRQVFNNESFFIEYVKCTSE